MISVGNYERRSMYLISQSGNDDCAFTCLAIMLANCHKDKNFLFLKHEDRQYSFKELIDIGKKYNTKLLGVKIPNSEELFKCKKFPILVILNCSDKRKHAVLVLKANRFYVTFFDPSVGKRRVKYSEFKSKWTHYALLVDSFSFTKCDIIAPDFYDRKDKIILPILQCLSGVTLLIGTYFIDKQSYFYIPILFFSLFVIFEVLFRDSLLKAMRRIDNNIYSYEIDNSNYSYSHIFATIQKYRYSALTVLPNLIYSALLLIFLAIILALNSYINIVYVVASLSLSFLEFFVFAPKWRNEEIDIEEMEFKLSNSESNYEFVRYSQNASEKAHSLGFRKMVFKYFEIAVMIVLSVVIMFASNSVNITYVIFYLCINTFMTQNITSVLHYASEKDKFDSLKAKVINCLKDTDASNDYL